MSVVHFPPRNRFSQQDKVDLYALQGRVTIRGQIGSIGFGSSDEGDEFATIAAAWNDEMVYGIGLEGGRYCLYGAGGEPLAEGRSLGEVLKVLAA